MKVILKMMNLKSLIAMILFYSFAANAGSHQPVKVDFNQMIDQNTQASQGLSDDLAKQYGKRPVRKVQTTNEKGKVTDFVDFEVKAMDRQPVAGQKPSTDRRYN